MSFIDKIVALAKSEGVNNSGTPSDKQADAEQEQSKSTGKQVEKSDKDESQTPPKSNQIQKIPLKKLKRIQQITKKKKHIPKQRFKNF